MAEEQEEEEASIDVARLFGTAVPSLPVSPPERAQRFSLSDIVVLVLGECTGIPLCIAGGEAFAQSQYGSAAIGWGLGIPLAITGATFSFWKEPMKMRIRNWFQPYIGILIPVAVLMAFAYVVGPNIYYRVAELRGRFPASPTSEEIVGVLAPVQSQLDAITKERDQLKQQLAAIQSQLDDTKHQLDAARRAAHVPAPPPPPEDQIPIRWNPDFQMLWGGGANEAQFTGLRFFGSATSLAHIKDAYIISNLTGRKEQLEVLTPYNGEHIPINKINPIPSGAQVWLVDEWKPPLPLTEFLNQWTNFEFVVVYDDKQYTRSFDQDYVHQKMSNEMSGAYGPRVTKRNEQN